MKYTDNQLITNSELDIYYSLSIDEFYDNAYYYLVGFINNSKLNLKYCYYNPTRNEHKEAASDSLLYMIMLMILIIIHILFRIKD